MGDTVALPNGRIEVEERPGYLFVVEHGTLLTVDEVDQYGAALELLAARARLRRALIDSRSVEEREPEPEVRDAMWRWLLSARSFDQIAFVLPSEMAVVRVNMLARSQRAGICAFGAVHEAHRWLTGRQRSLSQTFSAPLGGTATPVPPPRAESAARAASSTPPGLRRSQIPPARASDRPPPPARSTEVPLPRESHVPAPPRVPGAVSTGTTGRYAAVPPASDEVKPRTRPPSHRALDAITPPRRKPEER